VHSAGIADSDHDFVIFGLHLRHLSGFRRGLPIGDSRNPSALGSFELSKQGSLLHLANPRGIGGDFRGSIVSRNPWRAESLLGIPHLQ
jgi:hypothetical protein